MRVERLGIACVVGVLGVVGLGGAVMGAPRAGVDARVSAAAGPIDFAKVPRTIGKLPKFVAEHPLYGLFLFGPKGETRVWAVLDKSKASNESYDVLHLDRNANGDLTDDGAPILGANDSTRGDVATTFKIGRFVQPGTAADAPRVHTDFQVVWTSTRVSYHMNWNGGPVTMGCFGPDSASYGNFTIDPQSALILVPGHDLPFQFETWESSKLSRSGDNFFRVFVGNRGSTRGAFSCVDDKFLKADEFVVATLVYKDQTGKERNVRYELRERC